jgi:uncharacterized protein
MNKPNPGDVETRSAPAELTVTGNKLTGLIPFGVESRDFGGWSEVIAPGALKAADLSDLVCTLNHDDSKLLGRFDSTLTIEDRDDGLAWSCELPAGPTGQDVKEAVRRGDLNASSWRMVVGKDSWTGTTRTVEEVRALRDVAVVTTSAYPAANTRVELRQKPEDEPNPAASEGRPNDSQEEPMKEQTTGGLVVEERTAPAGGNIEERIFDAMASVQRGESRSLTHSTAAEVEPADLSIFLWDKLREQSVVLRSGVPVIATDRQKVTWPTLTADVEVGFYGELEEVEADDPEFDELTITPAAIKGLVKGSAEAFEDSDPDLLAVVQNSLVTSMSLKFDAEALVGGSSNGFDGLTKISGTQSLDMKEAAFADYDPFVAAVGLLAAANVPGPYVAVMHPKVSTAIARLHETHDEAESNLLLPAPEGLPQFFVTPQLPVKAGSESKPDTSSVVVYAPNSLAVVRRKDATVEIDRSQEFDHDAVLVRGKARAALGTAYPTGIVVINNVATPPITL